MVGWSLMVGGWSVLVRGCRGCSVWVKGVKDGADRVSVTRKEYDLNSKSKERVRITYQTCRCFSS